MTTPKDDGGPARSSTRRSPFQSGTGLMGSTEPGQKVTPGNVGQLPAGSVVRIRDGSRLIHLHDAVWLWCCDTAWTYDRVENLAWRLGKGATACHIPVSEQDAEVDAMLAERGEGVRGKIQRLWRAISGQDRRLATRLLAVLSAETQYKADLFDYICWLEETQQRENVKGADFLVLASDGTTCWGKSFADAAKVAMHHDKELYDAVCDLEANPPSEKHHP